MAGFLTPLGGVCYIDINMKTATQRINNIIGQLEGIKKVLATENKDCFQLITQLKAIKSASAALLDKIVKEELEVCLRQPNQKREKMLKIFEEVTKK